MTHESIVIICDTIYYVSLNLAIAYVLAEFFRN